MMIGEIKTKLSAENLLNNVKLWQLTCRTSKSRCSLTQRRMQHHFYFQM